MHSILYWYVLHTFYIDGMYNTPKNGMLTVRRDFIPKKYVMHTFVLTVYNLEVHDVIKYTRNIVPLIISRASQVYLCDVISRSRNRLSTPSKVRFAPC